MSIPLENRITTRTICALLLGVVFLGGMGFREMRSDRAAAVERRGDRATVRDEASMPTVAIARTKRVDAAQRVRFGKVPKGEYPLAPPVSVNPFDDEGNAYRQRTGARGPIPLRAASDGIVSAATGCSFAVDCDDGNPCTDDLCDIAPGGAAGAGTCKHDPTANGQEGDCDDGVFCNGVELCQGASVFLCLGTCIGGPNNGLACSTDAANLDDCPNGICIAKVCVGGPHDAAACVYDSECTDVLGACVTPGNPCSGSTPLCNENYDDPNDAFPAVLGGSCQAPCANDADCADTTFSAASDGCTLDYCCVGGFYTRKTCVSGSKIGSLCDGTNSTQCASNPCGNPVSIPCDVDGTCVRGNPCGGGALCMNRVCVGGGQDFFSLPCVSNNDCGSGPTQGVCTDVTLCFGGRCCAPGSCERRNFGLCAGAIGAKKWFPGDTGRVNGSGTTCPPNSVTCPKYGAGIGELGAFTVVAGPTSLSPVANLMSAAPLRKLGDDYDFGPTPVLITITDLRFVGGVDNIDNSRTSFEFYDQNGTFIEDIFFFTATNTIAVQDVQFDVNNTPFDIPSKGFIVAHVLQVFALDTTSPGKLHWLATDEVDHGANDAANLFVDTDLSGNPVVTPNFLKACVGGVRKGASCGSDGDCPASTCGSVPGILAFELEGPVQNTPPVGACCDGAGVCAQELEWVCMGDGRQFMGVGRACTQCSVDSSNSGVNCIADTDCSFCVGGMNDGLTCPANPCPGGACLGSCIPACEQGACCDTLTGFCTIVPDPGSCTGTWQGYGSDCVPNCCEQPLSSYTGADNCESVIVHGLVLPAPGEEVTITITGDNSAASSLRHCQGGSNNLGLCTTDVQCPGGLCISDDSCNPPTGVGSELGWFEGFDFFGCAYIRVDLCCTDTKPETPNVDDPKIPAYRILYDSCPCGKTIFAKRNPNHDPEEPADARGAPYCAEDNAWANFGPLRSGHYYYPIHSALGGQFGKYQLHITATACPEAACCHNLCAAVSGPACVSSADCTEPNGEVCINGLCQELCERDSDCSAGTCESSCALLNILDCQDIGGAFLAPPNRGTAITFCAGACDTGSCCLGAGVCEDEFPPGDLTLSIDDCDVLGGKYVGGFKCYGGTCGSGTRTGLSCNIDSQCPSCGIGNCCLGGAQSLVQPTPCPVCDIAGADRCQPFDDSVGLGVSDRTVPGGARVADDFVPAGDTITSVCVWGVYQKGTDFGGGADCASEVQDNFTVTIYQSDAITGLPSTVKGASTVTGANVDKGQVAVSAYTEFNQISLWAYKLALDTPITGLTPGATYWLEVNNETNNPAIQDPNCLWFWMQVDSAYNDYSASGTEWGYGLVAARTGDYAWCLDVAVTTPPAPERACCDCLGGCANTTKRDCDDAGNSWRVDHLCQSFTCPFTAPANDNCVDVLAGPSVGEDFYDWDNHCASTDGPNPVPTEFGAGGMAKDVWYKFVSDCPANSEMVFTTCLSGTAGGGGLDSIIAVYHNNANPTVCECPTTTTQPSLLWPDGLGNDEGCFGLIIGQGGLITSDWNDPTDNVNPGDCFLVRVGGFAGGGSEQGAGTLVIACSPVCRGGPCGPDFLMKSADDVCIGGANAGATCGQNSDCASDVCRLKNRYISALIPVTATANAIKVTIVSLHADSVLTPGNYTAAGTVSERWLGAPTVGISDGAGFPAFNVAKVQCAFPGLTNWSAAVGTSALHIYGDVIVPGSTYDVVSCDSPTTCSLALRIGTAKFGDVALPSPTVNLSDAFSIVANLQGAPTRPSKARADLVGAVLNPANGSAINFSDVSACVGAFQLKKFREIVLTPPATCP